MDARILKPYRAGRTGEKRRAFHSIEMWAIARYDLKLSDREFLRMSLRQFRALTDRMDAKERMRRYCFGVLACASSWSTKPLRPADFFPDLEEPMMMPDVETTDDDPKRSPEEIAAMMKSLAAMFGADDSAAEPGRRKDN